jgi:hypothetical protein
VEAVEINLALFEKLKKDWHPTQGIVERIRAIVPRHQGSGATEGITQTVAHYVPIGRRETHMVLHFLSADFLVRIIMLESKNVLRLWTFIPNHRHILEV